MPGNLGNVSIVHDLVQLVRPIFAPQGHPTTSNPGRRNAVNHNYPFAKLTEDDQMKVAALEQELGQKYGREVILIAYEKPVRSSGAQMEVGQLAGDINKRGSTFGYSDPHGDRYPTLGMLMYDRIAEGEDIRFSDAEPPNRTNEKKKK